MKRGATCKPRGLNFISPGEISVHKKQKHTGKIEKEEVIVVKDESSDKDITEDDQYSDEYEMEFQPKDAPEDKMTRIKIKCDSEDFAAARDKLKLIFKKDATYNIDGVQIRVKDNPAKSPMTVEMSNADVKGTATIKFFSGKDNTIMITKPSRQDFKVTKVLAIKVVKKMIDAILSKSLSDEGLGKLIQHSNNKTIGKMKESMPFLICNDCGIVFASEKEINTHMGRVHKQSQLKNMCVVSNCDFKSNESNQHISHMNMHHKDVIAEPSDPIPINECDLCTKQFTTNKVLQQHKKSHDVYNKGRIQTPGPNLKCKKCNFTAQTKANLSIHAKSIVLS